MKHMRKLASLLLALVMVFALATTAFADDGDTTGETQAPATSTTATTTISAPADSDRTYAVYQIFTGDLSGNILSNVKWGKNGTGTEGEPVPDKTLEDLAAVNGGTNTEKMAEISKYVNLNTNAVGTVSTGSPLTVTTGYYLIKDLGVWNSEENQYEMPDGQAYSLYVVQVVGPTVISPKVGEVTSEKKVDDKNDSNTSQDEIKWEDSADYDIGDEVPFKLTATIAEDYANYKVYQLTFHDVESAGLTFKPDSVVVKIDGTAITSGYEVVTTDLTDGCTFEVRFANLKGTAAHASSVITVEYKSTLNTNAVIGSAGNPNTMHVTYSNNPNNQQGGETGKTPDDKVIVFTYKVIVNKIDQSNNPLTGAGFTLYKKQLVEKDGTSTYEYVAVGGEVKGDTMTTFTWKGLDDGDYKIEETTTPAGYNTIAPIEFTITAAHEVQSADPRLTSLSGDVTSGTAQFTASTDTASLSTNVVNNSGTTLPSTGGIGTTIFYVVGSILVIGAAVLLVTKKRMSTDV